jgi:hypothetical protein
MVLLRYAAAACGRIDNLAVSCLDQLDDREARLCVAYEGCRELPLPPGPSLKHQDGLTRLLSEAVPVCRPATRESVLAAVSEIAPVAVVSHGPTHRDREGTGLRFRRRSRR